MLADVVGHLDGVGAVRFCSDGVRVGAPGRGDRHRSVAHARRPAVSAAARLDHPPMKHVRELRRRLDFQIMAHARHGADAATHVIQSERQRVRLVDAPGAELEGRKRLRHRVGRAPQFVRRGAVRIRGRGDQGIISEGQGPEAVDGRPHDDVAVLGPLITLQNNNVLVRLARARRFRDVKDIRTAARPARRAGVGAPAGHGRDRRGFTLARRDAVELLYTIIVRGLADPARAASQLRGWRNWCSAMTQPFEGALVVGVDDGCGVVGAGVGVTEGAGVGLGEGAGVGRKLGLTEGVMKAAARAPSASLLASRTARR